MSLVTDIIESGAGKEAEGNGPEGLKHPSFPEAVHPACTMAASDASAST